MPRVARDIIPDIPYHIIHRGNNRQKIFFSEGDYSYFLSLMNEAKKKHYCKIYSYVLMPNHIHFLLEPSQHSENLAKFVKLIAQKYAQYINASHKRTGTLWEGRFKSSPVSKDNYLSACNRYIELNPVRAKIIKDPKDYKWSSYRLKTGQNDTYLLLDRDPLYIDMGKDDAQRQANYKKWIMESIPQGEWDFIRKAANKGTVFGNIQFKEKLEKLLGRRLDIRDRGRPINNKK
jgi:putative transposase